MNITKDLKKLVSKEEDINLKNKKTDILDSLDLTYSLQKEEYKYTPLLKNVEKKFDLLKENKIKSVKNLMKRLQNLLTLNFILFQLTDILRVSFQIFPLRLRLKNIQNLREKRKTLLRTCIKNMMTLNQIYLAR